MKNYFPNSTAHVDLAALADNVNGLRKLAGGQKLMAVVKADAYGHGAPVCARFLNAHVDWFSVATVDEGIELRLSGVERPILVLGPPSDRTAPAYVSHNLTATVSSVAHFSLLTDGTRYQINLDTGMHRLGIGMAQLQEARAAALLNARLVCSGVYSHFATSDETASPMVAEQVARFEQALTVFPEVPMRHLANGAALFQHRLPAYGMVRAGLPLWGYLPGGPAAVTKGEAEASVAGALRPVLRWSSSVAQVRWLEAGESVSYGAHWRAPRAGWLCTVPVGYADGYPRLSPSHSPDGKGADSLWIGLPGAGDVDGGTEPETSTRSSRVPVVGVVTMDYVMAFTGERKLPVGAPVDLLGGAGPDAWDLAATHRTIPYEILTGIQKRVAREYERDGGLAEAPATPFQNEGAVNQSAM